MQSELKPCPFCGSDKHMLLSPTCDRSTPYNPADRAFPVVRCGGCYTDVPGRDFDACGKSAIEAWNRRAGLSAEQTQPVAVKALEWRQGYRYAGCNIVRASTLPCYQIRQLDGFVWLDVDRQQTVYPSVDKAKAAAQADYEQRIRSALAPAPAGEDVVPRLKNCGTYLAKDNSGRWHYLNYAKMWCGYEGPPADLQLQTLLKDALRVLDSYANPTSYLDSNGEYLPADAVLHDGLLAKDTAAKIRSALVDVPAEPVAHIIEGLNGEDPRVYLTKKYDPRSPDFWLNDEARAKHRVTPLYTSPPISREGEDTAEVIAALEFVALWAWREDPPAAARNLSDGERLSAIKYHPTIKALAATRSGSATIAKGGE